MVDEDARSKREHAPCGARFGGDDAADLEFLGADENLVAELQIELRHQLRPHQRAVFRANAWE